MAKEDAKMTELSFTILEDIIMIKDNIKSKDEILDLGRLAYEKVFESNNTYPEILIKAYKKMLENLESLSLSEILEIKEILAE